MKKSKKNTKKKYGKRRADCVGRTTDMEFYLDALYRKNGIQFHRVYDDDLQKEGVDVIFPGMNAYADEKVAMNSWGHYLGTRSLELTNRSNPGGIGWMFCKSHKTTHYVFVFVRSGDRGLKNIRKMDAMIVEKRRLVKYLADHGVHSAQDGVDVLRDAVPNEFRQKRAMRNGLLFTQSLSTPEQSICVRVPRQEIWRMAEKVLHWESPSCK